CPLVYRSYCTLVARTEARHDLHHLAGTWRTAAVHPLPRMAAGRQLLRHGPGRWRGGREGLGRKLMAGKTGRRQFGAVRKLPSGRWQASYIGPDGERHTARTDDGRPLTFDGRQYANAYLSRVHGDIQAGRWISPDAPKVTAQPSAPAFRDYANAWLEGRDL